MIGKELRDIFLSDELLDGLTEISSYLSSIKQERPIVYLLAKCFWKRRVKFQLEDKRKDLVLDGKRLEFKFNYDHCDAKIAEEFKRHGRDLAEIWRRASSREINKSWAVIPNIYEDVYIKTPKPKVFVWIICSRDLSKVATEDRKHISSWQLSVDGYQSFEPFVAVQSLFDAIQLIRPFSLIKASIVTRGDFPSTYYFWICEFDSDE